MDIIRQAIIKLKTGKSGNCSCNPLLDKNCSYCEKQILKNIINPSHK